MIKKAFTLVEISIALVVLGIILAITLKGSSLTDRARLQSDLAKMQKIATATKIYITKNPMNLPKDGNVKPLLIKQSLINEEDFITKYDKDVFKTVPCYLYESGAISYINATKDIPFNACIEYESIALGCTTEASIDDNNTKTGLNRTYKGVNYPNKSYFKCDELIQSGVGGPEGSGRVISYFVIY